jgi:hypothetical protein
MIPPPITIAAKSNRIVTWAPVKARDFEAAGVAMVAPEPTPWGADTPDGADTTAGGGAVGGDTTAPPPADPNVVLVAGAVVVVGGAVVEVAGAVVGLEGGSWTGGAQLVSS